MYNLTIPGWEQTQLKDLYDYGLLGNVNPDFIALIDTAESGGVGSGPLRSNTGYGGFFGLGPNRNYGSPLFKGGPTSVTNAQLSGTDAASFDIQAEVAAVDFNRLLGLYGGDPIKAEEAYQTGSASGPTEGSAIFQQAIAAGLPGLNGNVSPPASGQGAATTGSTGSGSSNQVQLSGIGGALQALDDVMNPTGGSTWTQLLTLGGSDVAAVIGKVAIRGIFAAGFLGIFYFGLKSLMSQSPSIKSPGILDTIESQQRIAQGNKRLELSAEQGGARIDQAERRISLATEAQAQRKSYQDARVTDAARRTSVAERQQTSRERREERLREKKKSKAKTAVKDAFETVGGAIA